MADLGNQKIKDTYQLVLQTDAGGNLQNLTGGTPSSLIVNSQLSVAGNISATTANLANISIEDQYLKTNGGNRIWLGSYPDLVPSYLIDDWKMSDNDHLYFGNDEDLDIYHNGNSYIDNDTGSLYITSSVLYLGDTTSETTIQDNLTVNDNLSVGDDLTVNTNTLYVDSTNGLIGVGSLQPTHKLTVSGGTGEFVNYNTTAYWPAGSRFLIVNHSRQATLTHGATNTGLAIGYLVRVTDIIGVTHTLTISSMPDTSTLGFIETYNGPNYAYTTLLYNDGTSGTSGGIFGVYNGTEMILQVSGSTVMSGSTDLLDIFASSDITNQDVYWSANTDGSITNSGNTDITTTGNITAEIFNSKGSQYKLNGDKALYIESTDLYIGHHQHKTYIQGNSITVQTATTINHNLTVTGNTNISGTTSYIGAVSGTGSVTAIGGFVGDVTGNASTVTNGVYTSNNLSVMAATTSAQLAGVISNETGTGLLVFGTDPVLTTPNIGTPSAGDLTSCDSYPGDSSLVTVGTVTTGTWASNRRFNQSSTTNHVGTQGDIVYFGGEGTIATGDIVYYKIDGTWNKADADVLDTAKALLGIALGDDAGDDGILLKGMTTVATDLGDTQKGRPLYLSGTIGTVTATAPTSGVVRIIGYQLGDDDEIWFDPDKTWVELS